MDIRQLQYFYTLCQKKNISTTAGIHYISQQGLSASIKKLESELGIPLFTRDGHGTYPNEYALEILPHVKKLLDSYATIQEISAKNKTRVSGTVEVSADLMLLDYIPHGTEAKLNKAFPNLAYNIRSCDDRTAMESILKDNADLAVISGPVDRRIFCCSELHRFPYAAVINREESLYRKDSITFEDLSGHKVILPSPEHNMNVNFLQHCRERGIEPDIMFFASDAHHLMYLCSSEPAVGIISSFYCSSILPRDFRIVPIEDPDFYWTIEIVSAKGRTLSPAAVCWRDWIIQASVEMKKMTSGKK
ncbi:MAG: LysR family transcriptional regulator [Emergencia sp.]